jgi:hypothetical protein
VLAGTDIFYSSISTRHASIPLKAGHHLGTGFKVIRIARSSIQKVGGLDKFRTERMLTPVYLKIGRESFG